jgi:hypothetical protein
MLILFFLPRPVKQLFKINRKLLKWVEKASPKRNYLLFKDKLHVADLKIFGVL